MELFLNHEAGSGYELLGRLGEGGQGMVVLVQRLHDHEFFAVKKLENEYDGHNQELHILQDILPRAHVRICNLHHAVKIENYTYLVLDYCKRGDLIDAMWPYWQNGGRIPEPIILQVFQQISEALAFIHYGYDCTSDTPEIPADWPQIIHRDLCPGNILVQESRDGSLKVKLADFGIATYRDDLRNDIDGKCYSGHPNYQPPEAPLATEKGDVFALGAIIFWMMHRGTPPDPALWLDPSQDQGYSAQIWHLMGRCLSDSASDRISSLELVQAFHRRWIRGRVFG